MLKNGRFFNFDHYNGYQFFFILFFFSIIIIINISIIISFFFVFSSNLQTYALYIRIERLVYVNIDFLLDRVLYSITMVILKSVEIPFSRFPDIVSNPKNGYIWNSFLKLFKQNQNKNKTNEIN